MKKLNYKIKLHSYCKNLLTTSLSALCSGLVITSSTQASDIDIYQQAKSGDITLMLMLDISGSMDTRSIDDDYSISNNCSTDTAPGGYTRNYCSVSSNNASSIVKNPTTGCTLVGTSYRCYDRISRLKDGVFDLLQGNTTKGIAKLDDKKIIGLSTLGVYTTSYYNTGRILVPARALNTLVGSQTQRDILLSYVKGLSASTNTPTARSYAEAVSYLMGTTTASRQRTVSDMPYYRSYEYRSKTSNSWVSYVSKCTVWNSSYSSCNSWSSFSSSESLPTLSDSIKSYACNINTSGNYYQNKTCYDYTGVIEVLNNNSGFSYSLDSTKNSEKTLYSSPASLTQTEDIKKCSGQGVYILTDGEPTQDTGSLPLMQGALGSKGQSFTCDDSGSWDCLNKMALALLDPGSNPANLKFKTAVVGFGRSFNDVPSYSKSLTQEQNILNLGSINTNVKRAAYWGIIGEGGWYSGSSSQDVVDSVNSFISSLGADIPAVTTGAPTVPRDSLNPSVLQKVAYYPQFQPTPDKTYQLWAGNLKKYNVVEGILKDKGGNKIVDTNGRLIDNYDLWAPNVDASVKDADETTYGSTKFALMGGIKSQLKLRTDANTENRKLLTNRISQGSGSSAIFVNSTNLRQVKISDLTDNTYKNDSNRGYLISLLGYAVDAANPNNINLSTAPELRQVGAVMHSSPILVTNKGKITYSNNILGSENRQDFILFGTTQGLLHVVDATTGKEKFAFVPNEMVENQKEAFLKYDTTSGGLSKLYYGIDAPWTTYTEYVVDSSSNLTVSTGRNSQKGKQIAYGGLRMGGRSYYALDLADIDNPKLLFQISPSDQKVYYNGTSKSFPALQYMGQSWSKPAIAWVKWGKSRKRVMFVGGGYDAGGDDGDARINGVKGAYSGYESDTYNQTNAKGGGIYMFDADNGDLLWWASKNATSTSTTTNSGVIGLNDENLKYSVVSEIRTEDRNGDGLVDHLYFGDLGGQLFRIDLDNNASSLGAFAKTPRLLLNLNASEKSPRFYEMPGFSIYDYAGKTFAVISIGTGNRSLPLKDYTVGTSGYDYDAVYNIYDKDVTRKDLYSATTFTKTLAKTDLGEITQDNRNNSTTLVAPYTKYGWYYRFKSSGSAAKLQSAKVFSTPIVLNSRMFVSIFDGSKPGLSGDCGAGVKGESFLQQFCMPYGQCTKATANDPDPDCTSSDGCSIGPGDQRTTIVDDKKCNPAIEKCDKDDEEDEDEDEDDKSNNLNCCISTGNRGATTISGIVSAGSSKICLVPQRWYELSALK
ncbi:PilC/PilY family type IV pilus protein [Acinetobacter ursingii]|uniref:PilC/PilY family type IV pilus protein n=1 Tax=Acinetobacter ursingii TaxID=108980 RepID=UPI003AFA000A